LHLKSLVLQDKTQNMKKLRLKLSWEWQLLAGLFLLMAIRLTVIIVTVIDQYFKL
jgi:hypothetical protein